MAIDFSPTAGQKKLQKDVREFANHVLAPIVPQADAEPDPQLGFALTKEAYKEAYKSGIAMCMIPKEYGGGGLSNIDIVLAAEEICAVDPGFACTILCNGLGLMPVVWYGSEEQKERFLRAATSDPSGEYLSGWTASEPAGTPGGTANFDVPLPRPAGIGVIAVREGDEYILNGRKYWPSSPGWDARGTNTSSVIVRTDPERGGTEGLSAIVVERETPGVTYRFISKMGHRLAANAEVIFDNARVPADNLLEGAEGNGDLVINRNFAWSGPVAGIAAVGVARAAYTSALEWAKTYTAGGPSPIIQYQNVGYILGDVAARIEACRYFCWKTAHYLDAHDNHAELIGAMCKVHCTELMFDTVYKCMQVVGVNSYDKKHLFEKYLREAACFPIYDGGNMGMQRRRVHGVIASPDFNPLALMEDEYVEFNKSMETIDTMPAHEMAGVGVSP
jgi:alkylation response protein AidB-like acyl-CoA dehydrogenase